MDRMIPEIQTLDPPESGFFSKKLDYKGIPIKSHTVVADVALREAYRRIDRLLQHNPVICSNLIQAGAQEQIIGRNQVTSDLPEFRHLKGKPLEYDPQKTIDERTRGVGGLSASCGEENLLGLDGDRYYGRDICSHEFAHTILSFGVNDFVYDIIKARYRKAVSEGLWHGMYAGSNPHEYFAELTMWHFGTRGDFGSMDPKPEPGRKWLKAYDPAGDTLLDDFYNGRIDIEPVVYNDLEALEPGPADGMQPDSSSYTSRLLIRNNTDGEYAVFEITEDGTRTNKGPVCARSTYYTHTYAGAIWGACDENGNIIILGRAEKGRCRLIIE
jgi:hypothetical protein